MPSGSLAAPASSVSEAPSLPYAGAPKVPNPLPTSIVEGDPCVDMLTPEQVSVGIADNVTVEVSVFLGSASRGKSNPCDVGLKVSDRVMTSLLKKLVRNVLRRTGNRA